ncbi:MAG: pantothenate kinase, partial [Oscillospiraceae bacterium]|nr:pantothenate kinase [Oscillospiraceae bacterium]
GTVWGNVYLMDGLIAAMEKELGCSCNVYATGGISKAIMPLCSHSRMINDNLLLEGLYIYYKRVKGL